MEGLKTGCSCRRVHLLRVSLRKNITAIGKMNSGEESQSVLMRKKYSGWIWWTQRLSGETRTDLRALWRRRKLSVRTEWWRKRLQETPYATPPSVSQKQSSLTSPSWTRGLGEASFLGMVVNERGFSYWWTLPRTHSWPCQGRGRLNSQLKRSPVI